MLYYKYYLQSLKQGIIRYKKETVFKYILIILGEFQYYQIEYISYYIEKH